MIADHSQRYQLANELHARPFLFHSAHGMVAFLAFKEPENAAQRDRTKDRRNQLDYLIDLVLHIQKKMQHIISVI